MYLTQTVASLRLSWVSSASRPSVDTQHPVRFPETEASSVRLPKPYAMHSLVFSTTQCVLPNIALQAYCILLPTMGSAGLPALGSGPALLPAHRLRFQSPFHPARAHALRSFPLTDSRFASPLTLALLSFRSFIHLRVSITTDSKALLHQ